MTIVEEPVVVVRLAGRNEGRCRSCHMRITWFRTIGGAAMPFDGQPELRNVRRDADDPDRPWIAEIVRTAVHWRTCPHAARWRKRR
jgi:hypothetical protein